MVDVLTSYKINIIVWAYRVGFGSTINRSHSVLEFILQSPGESEDNTKAPAYLQR